MQSKTVAIRILERLFGMGSLHDLHGGKRPIKTPDHVANGLREALERMIERGVVQGLISGETLEFDTHFEAYPPSAAFTRGHLMDMADYLKKDEDDE